MNFEDELKQKVQETEKTVYEFLPEEEGFQKTILEAMNYSMKAGGKRLRPLLMAETYRMFGGTGEVIQPLYGGHGDDPHPFPDSRRSAGSWITTSTAGAKRPPMWFTAKPWAILAGDALLNYAYETAARAFALEPGHERIGKAFQILTAKGGHLRNVGRSVRGCGV